MLFRSDRKIGGGVGADERGGIHVAVGKRHLNLLTNVVNQAQQGGKVMLDSVPVDPNMLNQFQNTMPQVKEQMKAAGKDPVLLVPPQLRPLLARYARLFAPGLHVLSYNEVPDELELKIMGALM